MSVKMRYFPGGKTKALTMSYDDGPKFDRRLIEIFNKYGIKGTFHLNSGNLTETKTEDAWNVSKEEVAELYKGHEVSVHTLTHPNPCMLSNMGVVKEIMQDKQNLEQLCGYPVRGMSYPFGAYDDDVLSILPAVGMEYSRTVNSTGRFSLPKNFLEWHPTAHHCADICEKGKEFLESNRPWDRNVMYVWGHSYEFNNDNNWELIEEFCELMSGHDNVWYATNIEIVDYVNAVRALKFTADETVVYNPSAISVWVDVDGAAVEVKGGETKKLK
ncbi:MAG: polysaccharide deacetylase family protein [Clostridia bacterium]|nr:polysaccharide deacetylase family protein [Clostridia bacterium]MBQ3082187.1 polysaccharide deacetylase family protein [Clostridia bacterium]